jgi:hypothetical protein
MSSFDSNAFLEELDITPVKTECVSPITGQIIRRSAPTMLKDSVAIITQSLQRYYDSKPKPVIDDIDDDLDYESILKNESELTYIVQEDECKEKIETLL